MAMALNTSALKLARFYLFIAAIVLTVVTFIVDAVALAALKSDYWGFGYVFSFTSHKGAAGFTMFVTIVSLFLIPTLAFGNVLAQKGFGFIEILNRVLYELISVCVLGLFWFISACVMAAYAGGECGSLCSKFNAATAFTWLTFIVILALSVVIGLMLHIVRTSGGNIQETLTHSIDGEYVARTNNNGGAGLENNPYPGATAGGNSYYNSSPAVNMPIPGDK
ncbi:hypothetical protein GGI13_007120 [Coemansia sp. RSA 455]|nr:hypothetical protein GGI13_007120 [Coemansia sp. RSA 455]